MTELFDIWFQYWYDTSTRYVEVVKNQPSFLQGLGFSLRRYLEGKKAFDTAMDEMWRALRPSPPGGDQPPSPAELSP
jgi:hypothetical protein